MKKLIIILSIFIFIISNIQICSAITFDNYFSTINNKHRNDNYTLIVIILKDTNKEEIIPYADLINLETIN